MAAPISPQRDRGFAHLLTPRVVKMKALEWHGNADVRVVERDIPTIVDPTDVLLRVTSTAICGSDLHLYHNEVPGMKKGDVMGHEFMGIIDEVGPAVKNFKRGDRVVCAFLISCGHCYYCTNGMYSNCDAGNPNKETEEQYGHRSSGKFGYSHLTGGFSGGQAEWVRVPFADNSLLKIPDDIPDEKVLLLSDVAATGYHATELGGVTRNQTVAVWGCGPVGLMALACAKLRGAARVIAIDGDAYRLEFARTKIGAEVIDFTKEDVLKALKERCPNGPDVCIDSAGFRFPKSMTERLTRVLSVSQRDTADILRECIFAVRKGGTVSIVGDYFTEVSHFPIGAFFDKGLNMRAGQTHVQRYWHHLLDCIQRGEFDPSFIISHIMLIDRGADAYRLFDKHEHACTKVLLKTPLGLTLSREQGTAIVGEIGAGVRPNMTPVAITQQAVYIDPTVIAGKPFPHGTASALSAQEELVGILPTTSGTELLGAASSSAAGVPQVHRTGPLGAEGDEILKQQELASQSLGDNQRAPIDGVPTGLSFPVSDTVADLSTSGFAPASGGDIRADVTPASFYAMSSTPDFKASTTDLPLERGEGLSSAVPRGVDVKPPGDALAEQALREGRNPNDAIDTWRQEPKVDL